MRNDINNLIGLYEKVITPVHIEQYYKSLDNYLNRYGMSIGENLHNPKLPYTDPKQKGLYLQNIQVGKIERSIKNGILTLDHISSYNEGQQLVKKIYPHDEEFASNQGLSVKAELVNDYTFDKFKLTFSDWKIKKIGLDTYIAIHHEK
jgi:hypothetical protein